MRVLVACEFSGRVREAFRALGHDAWSCDLVGSWDRSEFHYTCDVTTILDSNWDLLIAHPPCTYLANSGVRWFTTIPKKKTYGNLYGEDRYKAMLEGVEFFNLLLNCSIPKIAVENPIMHGQASKLISHPYNQIIQPYMFGDGEVKSTCLWLKNLDPLKPTDIVDGRFGGTHYLGWERIGSKKINRKLAQKLRSVTFQGIANAMASQWGGQQ